MSPKLPLDNIATLAFESRMADSTIRLLQRKGAQTISAPSMQEVPLKDHTAVFDFGQKLLAGEVDILICNTGVGTNMMMKTLQLKFKGEEILASLSAVTLVARGPKPAKVLRSLGLSIDIKVSEPNTWKEILKALSINKKTENLSGKKIAIQEYGEANEQLNKQLRDQGAELIQTSIYRWALPDDLAPLKKGIQTILAGEVDIVLFTSKTQAYHVMKVAEQMEVKKRLQEALKEVFVASIGSVCSKGLQQDGIHVDFEPSRPKLAIFINEVAEQYPGKPAR